jgi:2,3-bisphosphoglycerate-independent phosphoglycerate mutase
LSKTVLVITDGIGYNEKCEYNAFKNANTPTYDWLFENVPNSLIKTYGMSVGLPDGQMGNSEVGHMCIGSGRVLYQDLVKINMAVENDTIKDNEIFKNLVAKSRNLHLVGLLSDGGVHSHIDHIISIAKTAKICGKRVYLHLITDGRDVSPTSATSYISQIESICEDGISIATIGGRFYTMDRDNRWDRVEAGFRAIYSGENKTDKTATNYIEDSYEDDILDEFIVPATFGDYEGIVDDDGIIFCNFRSDRMREIVTAIGDMEFSEFDKDTKRLNITTMTQYDKSFPYPILFEKENPKDTLSEIISKNSLKQLHTAETEKYAHVTFFFNGGVEEPFENETRVLIPSPKVKTYDEKPDMSANEVGEVVIKSMKEDYDFIVVNFANGDMVGHTGIYEAGIEAVEAVDKELGKIVDTAKECGYNLVITSDHGNCEMMRDGNGAVLTNHTVGDVFCFVMSDRVKEIKDGGLNNIAPTVLKLMDIDTPEVMDEALF